MSSMLSRRRLFQLSIHDMLLVTTAATAMLVGHQALAPRVLVYTAGFVGGLIGTAVALNRERPRAIEALCLGGVLGIVGGYLAAFAVEALYRGFPFESDWKWQFRLGRVPATDYAALYGFIGGATASSLSTLLAMVKSQLRQQRERQAMIDAE